MAVARVRSRAAFAALAQHGAGARHGTVRVRFLADSDGDGTAAVAYAVGRAIGSAVARNRVRRRLRALVAELDLPAGTYLLSASPAAALASFDQLRADLAAAVAAVTRTSAGVVGSGR